jgi:hypothetical protein
MYFKDTGCDGVNYIHLLQGTNQWHAFMNTVIKASGSVNSDKFLDYLSDNSFLKKDPVPCN